MTFYDKIGWEPPEFTKEGMFYVLKLSDHRIFTRSDLKALRDHLDDLLFGGEE